MAHSQERGHDSADHLAQKGVADHLDGDRTALPSDPHPMKCSDRLSILPAKGGEVTTPDEDLRRRGHRRDVKVITDAEGMSLAQRTLRPVPDQVAVFPMPGPVTRVEASIDSAQRPQADVRWKQARECSSELLAPEAPVVGECDHLTSGVDSGVRPSRAIDTHPAPRREARQSAFQLSLHCPPSGLQLEAGKVSSVVFDPCAVTNGAALSGRLSGGFLAVAVGCGQTSSS